MRRMGWLPIVVALVASSASLAETAPLPRDSVYQREARLTDDRGQRFGWSSRRGQPQLVSMFYTSCTFTCPLIVESARAVEQSLSPAERAHLGVLLISFDPERDTPTVLARMRKERSIDAARWTLARPDVSDVRAIAALLGVRYRALADGDFNHTSVLLLLDAEGRIVARTERVGGLPDAAFVAVVRRVLADPEALRLDGRPG